MNNRIKIIYEITFSLMALTCVIISVLDLSGYVNLQSNMLLYYADLSILVIFAIDYFARLAISKNKKAFIRANIPDLIAIIPFSSAFKIFRVAKLFRLVKIARLARVFALFAKLKKSSSRFLKTNGLQYMLIITGALILLGALGIYLAEKGQTVHTFWDAIWWSFVTATTVGYGDISPSTGIGRAIAGILMLLGIGTIGLLTGTIATYFLGGSNDDKMENNDQVLDLTDLKEEQFKEVVDFVEFLKSKRR